MNRSEDSHPSIESRIGAIGREIFAAAGAAKPSPLRKAWWEQRILDWSMQDSELAVRLFRFVDVLPALRDNLKVADHLNEYLKGDGFKLPLALRAAVGVGSLSALTKRATGAVTRANVRMMSRRFISGETIAQARQAVARLRSQRMAFTIDLLGEYTTSETQADDYARRYLEILESLSEEAGAWPEIAQIDRDRDGPLPRVNVSVKISSLDSHYDGMTPERCVRVVGERLRPIFRRARELNAFVNIDMEQFAYKDLTLHLFKSILAENEFRDWPNVGIVIQAYLKDSERDLLALADWAEKRGAPVWVRLVKGAYWDYETMFAVERDWPIPVWTRKWESDVNFEKLTRVLFDNRALTRPALASHNVRSIAHAIARAEAMGVDPREYEFQMLFGMGDELKRAVVERGLRVRVYTPYGPLIPGMGYLIRRLLENTSNDSFLRQSYSEKAPMDKLLADPGVARPPSADVAQPVFTNPWEDNGAMPNEKFQPVPLIDYAIPENRAAMEAALKQVESEFGRKYPLVIGGDAVPTEKWFSSTDPADPKVVVGLTALGTIADADRAVMVARQTWPKWAATPVSQRADLLRALADRMHRRRHELSAWMVREVGKPWREADADTVEAIDFCNFYAAEMERIHQRPRLRNYPGEDNCLVYEPKGVAVIIAPWNFPLAILTGMTTAALVAGNTVIVKPAALSSVIAAKLFEAIRDAGFPPGVANFMPSPGGSTGAHLVAHPGIDLIAFTGSREVGLGMIKSAADTKPGQQGPKRVIAELGGKNAIVVDDDADLDEAVKGITYSAFGFAGQKCSACSRVVVLESVHAALMERLIDTTKSLKVGPPVDPEVNVGPVVGEGPKKGIDEYIEIGRKEGRVVCENDPKLDKGYYVPLTIVDGVDPKARIAQEEIFGPVLAVIKARDFDEALRIANGTDYALTGGIYSRSPAHLDRARREFRVGNLYINRGITGAIVDRQPFGGFKMSGVGSKAGGPDYLIQFCEPKTITENTLRHGFAPTDVK